MLVNIIGTITSSIALVTNYVFRYHINYISSFHYWVVSMGVGNVPLYIGGLFLCIKEYPVTRYYFAEKVRLIMYAYNILKTMRYFLLSYAVLAYGLDVVILMVSIDMLLIPELLQLKYTANTTTAIILTCTSTICACVNFEIISIPIESIVVALVLFGSKLYNQYVYNGLDVSLFSEEACIINELFFMLVTSLVCLIYGSCFIYMRHYPLLFWLGSFIQSTACTIYILLPIYGDVDYLQTYWWMALNIPLIYIIQTIWLREMWTSIYPACFLIALLILFSKSKEGA